MSETANELKAKALAEVAKIKDAAVAEYLTIKTSHFSGRVLAVVALVALVVGVVLGHKL
jgi:hypothetical protein